MAGPWSKWLQAVKGGEMMDKAMAMAMTEMATAMAMGMMIDE